MALVMVILLSLILIMFIVMTYRLHVLGKNETLQGWIYAAIVLTIIALVAAIYFMVKGTPWEGHLIEWLNIVVRVMHITFGIAWIGASFYFVFLENALNRTENVRDELAGNLWAVHGGGFYYLEKYKVAPKELPKTLHWFKYEAYFTWITGFALLFIIYYFNASAMLVNKEIANITPLAGIGIGVGSFVAAWIIYDLLCKSALIRKPLLFSLLGFIILAFFAWFYSQVFTGRAAFMHFGAMIGTIMVANVFFVIIPSQKAMVNAAKKGIAPDGEKGKHAGLRSLHNNYFTLPVLFVMVSNHFPSTFSNQYQWLVLVAITLGTAGIKHYLNLRERGQLSTWVMPVSAVLLLAVGYITAPKKQTGECKNEIPFSQVKYVIEQRCMSCHSSRPTDNVYTSPPNGVSYDVPAEVVKLKDKIMQQVVVTKTMPLNNKTNMTPEERDIIKCWIEQGAKVQ